MLNCFDFTRRSKRRPAGTVKNIDMSQEFLVADS
jgi:hypothetical protein